MRKLICFLFCINLVALPGEPQESVFNVFKNQGATEALAKLSMLQKSPYDFGLELNAAGRHDDALLWYNTLTKKFNDPIYFVGKAWTHWLRQETDQAKKDASLLIKSDVSELVRARAHYLLSIIAVEEESLIQAESHSNQSHALYESLSNDGGLYLVKMIQAKIALLNSNFEEAEALIVEALSHNAQLPVPYPEANASELRGEIALRSGNWPLALEYATEARNFYFAANDDQNGWLMTARMGLLNAVLGNVANAYFLARETDAMAKAKKMDVIRAYNYLTWVYLDRCSGKRYQKRSQEIRQWLKHQKTEQPGLLDLLDFVEKLSCP